MPSQRLPKLCHHRRSGAAYVTLDGRQFTCGKWNTKAARAEYDRLLGLWIANGRKMPEEGADGPSVTQLCVHHMRWALTHYRREDGTRTSEVGCLRAALRRLRQLYGAEDAASFGPVKLKLLRETWIADGLARSTINANVRRIQRTFRWCVGEELIPADIAHALDCVRGLQKGRSEARETAPVPPVSEADVRATLPHLSPQAAAIVELCWWTAMRPGEAVQLRMGDIDRSDAEVWTYTPRQHKTAWRGRERPIQLGPNAQRILKPWLRADPDAYLFQPREAEAQRNAARREQRASPMTPSQRARGKGSKRSRAPGAHYSTESLRRSIRRACERAGIEPWAPNRLRHAAATRLRHAVDLESARVALGHASASITTTYAELDARKARAVMAQYG